jgi:DnaJ family protein B protein 12
MIPAFQTGPGFAFSTGGPGIRVTQFGGGGPRRRPRPDEQADRPTNLLGTLTSLLPLILFFLIPLLSSIFTGSSSGGPSFRTDMAVPPHTHKLQTSNLKVPYWVTPATSDELSGKGRKQLDVRVDTHYVRNLHLECQREERQKEDMYLQAQGWLFNDEVLIEKARKMKMPSCDKYNKLLGKI